jgi:hypothetical protein
MKGHQALRSRDKRLLTVEKCNPVLQGRVYDAALIKSQIKFLLKVVPAPCWGGIHVFRFCTSGVNMRSPNVMLFKSEEEG